MTPEFYLVLSQVNVTDALTDAIFEAGFDDAMVTMRGARAAIWIRHRSGELTDVVRGALAQATQAGLSVDHVEIENEAFATP